MPRPPLLIVALLTCASVLFVAHAASYWDWTEDDAFISLRYARNLVEGQGLVFNEGEKVEGYSNFAWVLLGAAAMKLGFDPLVAMKSVGVLGGLLAVVCSWFLALRMRPEAWWGALLAPFFLAIAPVMPRHAVTGLETAAYAGMVTLAVLLAAGPRGTVGRVVLLGALLLVSLLRPEGVAVAILMLVWRWPAVQRRTGVTGSVGAGGRIDLAIFSLLFAIYYFWRMAYFGAAFTNTFYFKMTGGAAAWVDGLHYSLDFLRETGGAALVGLVAAVLLVEKRPRTYWLILLLCAGQGALVMLAGGDWMHHYRFYAPVLPLLAAAAAVGASAMAGLLEQGTRPRLWSRLVLGLVLAAAVVNIYKTEQAVARLVMPAVKTESYLAQSYERIGRWLEKNTPSEAIVAVSDVGAVGYFSKRRIVDMFGLVDAHIARQPGRLHFKSDPAYVLLRRPDYVLLVESAPKLGADRSEPTFLRIPDGTLYAEPRFRESYFPVREFTMGFVGERAVLYRVSGP